MARPFAGQTKFEMMLLDAFALIRLKSLEQWFHIFWAACQRGGAATRFPPRWSSPQIRRGELLGQPQEFVATRAGQMKWVGAAPLRHSPFHRHYINRRGGVAVHEGGHVAGPVHGGAFGGAPDDGLLVGGERLVVAAKEFYAIAARFPYIQEKALGCIVASRSEFNHLFVAPGPDS